jgi:hypothetical protein
MPAIDCLMVLTEAEGFGKYILQWESQEGAQVEVLKGSRENGRSDRDESSWGAEIREILVECRIATPTFPPFD